MTAFLAVGDRVRVARSEAGHEMCVGGVGTITVSGSPLGTTCADFDNGGGHYGPASDFERIDPEPTPEPTVTVPVSLIDAVLHVGVNGLAADRLRNLAHPKPTPHRLRVVDLDAGRRHDYPDGHRWSFLGLDSAPDLRKVVEEAVRAHVYSWRGTDYQDVNRDRADLVKVIMAAIEKDPTA